jgi:hypothetical protein
MAHQGATGCAQGFAVRAEAPGPSWIQRQPDFAAWSKRVAIIAALQRNMSS